MSLAVADLDKAVQFYREGSGLPQMESPPSVAFFSLSGTWLGLSLRDDLASDAGVSPDGSGYSSINLAQNVATEAEVDQTLEQAITAGTTPIKSAQKAGWGGYHAYFADPDEHIWEVAHNPFFWVGPKDN